MSFIEGIGDEVTAFIVIILVLVLAATVTFIRNTPLFYSINIVNSSEIPSQSGEASLQSSDEAYVNNTEHRSDNNGHYSQSDNNGLPNSEINATNSSESAFEEIVDVTEHKCDNAVCKETEEQCSCSSKDTRTNIYPDLPNPDLPSAPEIEDIDTETEQSSESGDIRIRLKFLDDTERTVTSNPSVKIGDFKRIHFPEDIASNKVVRLIFSGQLLRDDSTLQHYGVANNCVIHIQILQAQATQNATQASQNTDLDLSNYLWPLLSFILGICWVLYFKFPDFFNKVSLGMLVIFTVSFAYCYVQVQNQ